MASTSTDTAARWASLAPRDILLLAPQGPKDAPEAAVSSGLVVTRRSGSVLRVDDIAARRGWDVDMGIARVRAWAVSRANGLLAVLEAGAYGGEVALRVHLLELDGTPYRHAKTTVLDLVFPLPDADAANAAHDLSYALHLNGEGLQVHVARAQGEIGVASPLWEWRRGLVKTFAIPAGGFDALGVWRATPAQVFPLSATTFLATFQPTHDGTDDGYEATLDGAELVIDALAVVGDGPPKPRRRAQWLTYPDCQVTRLLQLTYFDDQPEFRLVPHVHGDWVVLEGNMGVTHHVAVLRLVAVLSADDGPPPTLEDVRGSIDWVSLPGSDGCAAVHGTRVVVCCYDLYEGHMLYVGDYGGVQGGGGLLDEAVAAAPPPLLPGFKLGTRVHSLITLPDNGDPLRRNVARYSMPCTWVRAPIDWGSTKDDVNVAWVQADASAIYLGTTLGIVVLSF